MQEDTIFFSPPYKIYVAVKMFKKKRKGSDTFSRLTFFYDHYLFEQTDHRCLQFGSPFRMGDSKVLVRVDKISRADPGRRIKNAICITCSFGTCISVAFNNSEWKKLTYFTGNALKSTLASNTISCSRKAFLAILRAWIWTLGNVCHRTGTTLATKSKKKNANIQSQNERAYNVPS